MMELRAKRGAKIFEFPLQTLRTSKESILFRAQRGAKFYVPHKFYDFYVPIVFSCRAQRRNSTVLSCFQRKKPTTLPTNSNQSLASIIFSSVTCWRGGGGARRAASASSFFFIDQLLVDSISCGVTSLVMLSESFRIVSKVD